MVVVLLLPNTSYLFGSICPHKIIDHKNKQRHYCRLRYMSHLSKNPEFKKFRESCDDMAQFISITGVDRKEK